MINAGGNKKTSWVRGEATISEHHLVSEGGHLRSSIPNPNTDFVVKIEVLHHEQPPGLSIHRDQVQHETKIPTRLGEGSPSFRNRVSQIVLPQLCVRLRVNETVHKPQPISSWMSKTE